MLTGVMGETLVMIHDVAARYPARNGRRKHVGVVRRWIRKGVAGVRLEGVQIAGQWFTSEEALRRFHAAVAKAIARRAPTGRACRGSRPLPPDKLARAHAQAEAFNAKVKFSEFHP